MQKINGRYLMLISFIGALTWVKIINVIVNKDLAGFLMIICTYITIIVATMGSIKYLEEVHKQRDKEDEE